MFSKKAVLVFGLFSCLSFVCAANKIPEPWVVEVSNIQETTLPILPIEKNLAIIPIEIDGNKNLRFLFSTSGYETILVANKRTKNISWQSINYISAIGLIPRVDKFLKFVITKGKTLNIGGVSFTNVNLFRVHVNEFIKKEVVKNYPIDGFIGNILLSGFIIDVDRKNNVFTLHPKNTDLTPLLKQHDNVITVPLIIDNGVMFTKLQLQLNEGDTPQPYLFKIDSSDSAGLILPATFDNLSVEKETHKVYNRSESSKIQSIIYRTVNKISFDDSSIDNVNASFFKFKDEYIKDNSNQLREYGIFGAAFLAKFRNIYDLANNVLYLIPDETSFESFISNGFLPFTVMFIGDNFSEILVSGVDTSFEKNLKVGDKILSINKQSAKELSETGLTQILAGKKEGDLIEVCKVYKKDQKCFMTALY